MPALVACAGIVVLDRIMRVHELPAGDSKTHATAVGEVVGGMAANAARAVCAAGGHARLAAFAGDDEAGARTAALLEQDGVDAGFVQRIAGSSTSVSAICIDDAGLRQIVNYLAPELINASLGCAEQLLDGAQALFADLRHPTMALDLLAAAAQRKMPALLDYDLAPPPEQCEQILGFATHCIFSEASLRNLESKEDDLADCLAAVRGRHPQLRVAATCGANGVIALDEDGHLRTLRAFPVEAVDTLGAGDIFHGAAALMLAEGQGFFPAMRFASAAAALKCAREPGAKLASRTEIEDLLAAHAIDWE